MPDQTITPADTERRWLVIASICDCDRVAVTLMDRWQPGTECAGEDETTTIAVGDDWRYVVPSMAREHSRDTGLPISGQCTVTIADDPGGEISRQATALVYAAADLPDDQPFDPSTVLATKETTHG